MVMRWRKLDTQEKDLAIKLFNRWDSETSPRISECSGGITGTVEQLYNHGGILVAEGRDYCGLGAYCFGEPTKNFENKETCYIYDLVIDKESRGVAIKGFAKTLLEEMISNEASELKFKGEIGNPVNRLLIKIGEPLAIEKNAAGTYSILYSTDINQLKDLMGVAR